MKNKEILWFNIIGWVFFGIALLNVFGIFKLFENNDDVAMDFGLSIILPIPDFKTVFFAGIGIVMGVLSIRACKKINNVHKKGIGLVISGVACIAFSLTPVADAFSLVPVVMRDTVASLEPDQYIEITDEEYNIYAFLGTSSSKPEDHDILEYKFDDFDGSTKEVYSKYKVCGYLSNKTDYKWYNVKLEVVLIDDDENDILIDGKPVTLTAEFPYSIRDGGIEKFETNTVSANNLSVQPTKFRIKSVVIAT